MSRVARPLPGFAVNDLEEQLGVAAGQHGLGDVVTVAVAHLPERLESEHDRRAELASFGQKPRKVFDAGQVGYFRAISGMVCAIGGNLEQFAKRMPAALRLELKDPEIKRHIALKQVSFESSMKKRAAAALSETARWR